MTPRDHRHDVGWGDTYYQYVAGQSINITRVPNGWYYLKAQVNPLGRLYEGTSANDAERRLLHLGGTPGDRRVVIAPWHGIQA